MSVVEFRGSHSYLDASLHLLDLRGRNALINAVRWATALKFGGRYVHVHVEGVGDIDERVGGALAYLIYPARMVTRRGGKSEVVKPLKREGGGGVCTLCGRPIGSRQVLMQNRELYDHVARGEELCEACFAARLFGRAVNKPAYLFVVGRGEPPCVGGLDIEVGGDVRVLFFRHGAGCSGRGGGLLDDVAVLQSGKYYVGVFGVRSDGRVLEAVERFFKSVRGAGQWERVACAREEAIVEVAELALGVKSAAYQPEELLGDVAVVPHLSGFNLGGRYEVFDTETVARHGESNTLFVVRVDGDRFGEFSRLYSRERGERRLSMFKSAVAGIFEAYLEAAVVYAGGDENMVLAGARDGVSMVKTLERVRSAYRELGEELGFPLTISASVVAVRFKAPMYYAAYVANVGVEKAKEAGRDALYFAYLRGYSEDPGGVVKFGDVNRLVAAAYWWAEQRPNVQDLWLDPHAVSAALLRQPYSPSLISAAKDLASFI